MKIKTIQNGNIIILILFLIVQLVMYFFPNSYERLKEKQETYAENGVSDIDNGWAYFLINEEFPLEKNYSPALDYVQGTFMMDERCAEYARAMIKDAEEDGIDLCVVSAYRSIEKQTENLEAYIERLKNEGLSDEEAEKSALREIAEPGKSEHNAGLAIDILTYDWWATHDDITDDFENTEEFEWLNENAYKYGFILRYPKEWENTTGYAYEPWHYRFVGVYYAEKIKNSGLPFEYYYKMNF
ncbi:MAG: M15 family metallopeptidase [Ruminiclostridium sp.]|nr:M15 family metallopeptidase [Ruminiclostridium sp.]